MGRADLPGQREQPPELRRHHVRVGHPVPLDEAEHRFRVEPVHQYDRMAELDGDRREVEHRRVVERRAAQVHVPVERRQPEQAEEPGAGGRDAVRVLAGERAPHALRAARGARCVDHGRALGARRRAAFASGAKFGQRREPGDGADGEPGGWGDPRLIRRRRRDGGEPLVRHERARAAVAEYVGDLGGGQVPVDRHHVQPGLHRGEEQREDRGAVGQHPGHAVAWAEPERPQAPADLVGPRGQSGVADDRAVRLDHRRAVRVLRCDGPQADVSHGA